MALNLWKVAGKPTSYNPLPTTLQRLSVVPSGLDLTITLKAKSATNARLFVWVTTEGSSIRQVTLTPEFKEYKYQIKTLVSNGEVLIYDPDSKGDIIIEDIELIEKPLPKLTINGIDGFTSGKWTLHSQAKVIDDETVELNATANFQESKLTIPCLPNTDYYFYAEGLSNQFYVAVHNTGMTTAYANSTNNGKVQFKTGTGTTIDIKFYNGSGITGKFTFKRPMLNLGSTPAPYEKKRGDRMVLPVPKKNLIPTAVDDWEQGSMASANGAPTTSTIRLRTKNFIPNTIKGNVVMSGASGYQFIIMQYDSNFSYLGTTDWQSSGYVSPIMPTCQYIKAIISKINNAEIIPNEVEQIKFQLEEGTTPTEYQPYSVQLNPKPKRYVPKKNLFDKNTRTLSKYIASGVLGSSALSDVSDFITIKPNTNYYLSNFNVGGTRNINFFTLSKTYISEVTTTNGSSQFTTPSNAYYVRFSMAKTLVDTLQLEESTIPTPFENYQLVLPRAKTGLQMDGINNYLQLPSMTMDSIEIDCLIDSVQPVNTYVLDVRPELTNGFFYIASNGTLILGSGFTSFVNGISSSSYPFNERVKLRLNATSSFTKSFYLFTNSTAGGNKLKGILYGVKCYLNGNVVAEYDFTNPNNIIGDKILNGKAQNLIPSFEDSRWNLHANFKVLGKDVGRLDATGAWQWSKLIVKVKPNTNYWVDITTPSVAELYNVNETSYVSNAKGQRIFNSGNNTELLFRISASSAGSFDFIKPQLYELTGKEGTLYGNPVPQLKPAKRTLYAKR